ncbi:MAG: alpha/beta fold hydrolase [Thermodesulfobacteriota bacterium]|nr:alpha/beta fold hydrolase [Thermodesulfobacteriota bacterium]
MKIIEKAYNTGKFTTRVMMNDLPARLINAGYNIYSKIYKGQITLGLPVSSELLINQEEIQSNAVGKLALTLYHIFLKATGKQIPRYRIKSIIVDELDNKRLHLTENVILLSKKNLGHIAQNRFNIHKKHLPIIENEAERRFILKESLKNNKQPAYFESEIDERESNGRGDYETVYYRAFTEKGKEIRFRRVVSMEDVTAGDNNPSVILIPGFANNSHCFNISTKYSIARDMADSGMWVYLFDPRGMGINVGTFDPYYTVDTLIDYDLPAVIESTFTRSNEKPSILVGHSMGGVVAENMILNSALRLNFDNINFLSREEKIILDNILISEEKAKESIPMVKGIISLGSPKFFDRQSHLFFPIALWLNHFSRIFNLSEIPVQEMSKIVTELPCLKGIIRFICNNNLGDLNFLISPENHKNDKYFIEKYLKSAMESIPLGLGFQCLRAIYDGNGFKRMDSTNLNYSNCFSFFPESIPLFHFWGTNDCLAPVTNMKYSKFYPHKIKKVYRIDSAEDLKNIEITSEPSQLIDFVIKGASHIDLLYGTAANEIVYPLVEQITEKIWGDWTYGTADISALC